MATNILIRIVFVLAITESDKIDIKLSSANRLNLGFCAFLAGSNFTEPMTVTPQEWGIRLATAKCDLTFTGDTAYAGHSWIFMRFNVMYLSFTNYLAVDPDPITFDPKSKWLILRSDYTYVNTLTNNFVFHYSEFLGDDSPKGDCWLFNNYTEALQLSVTAPDLTDELAEPVVANSSFTLTNLISTSNGWDLWRVECRSTIGVPLGRFEAHTYVNLIVPVYNITSLYGTEIIAQDSNSTWYFGRYQSHVSSFVDEAYQFEVPAGETGFNVGYCSVYTVTNSTVDGVIAMLNGVTVVVQTTITPAPTNATVTYVIDASYSNSGLRRMMVEYTDMRTQMMCNVTETWSLLNTNQLACGRQCLTDPKCFSIFFLTDVKTCLAHTNVYSLGDCIVNAAVYYVVA